MKRISLVCSLLVLLLSSSIVNAMPKDCPNAVEIQAIGISTNVIKINNAWFAGRRNQAYGTPDNWTFIIANIMATDALDAYKKAAKALQSLAFLAGPAPGSSGKFVCAYNTVEGYSAFAMTPAAIDIATAAKLVIK